MLANVLARMLASRLEVDHGLFLLLSHVLGDFHMERNAQRAAAREIEDSRRNADVEVRQLMAEAEQRAGEETEKILAKARTECEKMQSAARANLERAAQWIAEEVVNDKWQS